MKPTPRKKLRRIRRMDMDALSNSELGLLFGAVALGLAVLCWMVLGWFIPDPKATLKIATGSSVGAYYQYAQEYKRLLLDHGIEAEVVETNGTVDNFMRRSYKRGLGRRLRPRLNPWPQWLKSRCGFLSTRTASRPCR
jgi:hypothetical protein